jgi:hypothetical protein
VSSKRVRPVARDCYILRLSSSHCESKKLSGMKPHLLFTDVEVTCCKNLSYALNLNCTTESVAALLIT